MPIRQCTINCSRRSTFIISMIYYCSNSVDINYHTFLPALDKTVSSFKDEMKHVEKKIENDEGQFADAIEGE